MFWLLMSLCQGVRFRTVITNRFNEPVEVMAYVVEVSYLPLVVGMMLINCWADVRPKYTMETQTIKVCAL